MAFGAEVFPEPDSCLDPEIGYRVAYPNTWYLNAALPNPLNPAGEGIAACQYFAPADFGVVSGTEISSDVAITIQGDELPSGMLEFRTIRAGRQGLCSQ